MDVLERLAARLVLEDSQLDFTRYFFKARFGQEFIVNWHHGAVCERLQAVEMGQIRNLIISLPPGAGKTELLINWAARTIARNALSRFLMLSYADELVALNSQSCRNLIQCEEYQELWPRLIADDSKAKKRWNVMDGGKVMGGMYASTPHAQVTGFRAGYMSDGFNGAIIIDDPMKAADAESDVRRKEINTNIARTVRSRRAKPSVPIILVQQRLHEEDTTGWLLAGELGEEFDILKIPAIVVEEGRERSYWEFKEPLAQLKSFQAAQPYIFNAQYQQNPAPEQGSFYSREMFVSYTRDELPEHLHNYGASDYAVTEGGGDSTVHGVLGLDEHGNPWLVDWWRGQTKPNVSVDKHLEMVRTHEPLAWADEKGVIEKSLGPFIEMQMAKTGAYCYRVQYASTTDKCTRARSFQAFIAVRKLRVPKDAPWVADFLAEMLKFGPNAKEDDQVDVCSLFGRMLMGITPGQVPIVEQPKKEFHQLTVSDFINLEEFS